MKNVQSIDGVKTQCVFKRKATEGEDLVGNPYLQRNAKEVTSLM